MPFCEASSSHTVPLLWKGNILCLNGWLSQTVDNLLPFHICEQERFYGCVMHACINVDTLVKYVGLLMKPFEQKKAGMLPDRFAIMFGGWCNAGTHYVAIFSGIQRAQIVDLSVRVAFSPFENKEPQAAAEQVNLINFVLRHFGKSSSNIVALIADSCAVNKSVA